MHVLIVCNERTLQTFPIFTQLGCQGSDSPVNYCAIDDLRDVVQFCLKTMENKIIQMLFFFSYSFLFHISPTRTTWQEKKKHKINKFGNIVSVVVKNECLFLHKKRH